MQHYSQLPNGSLQINTVQLADRGRFTCTADSIAGVKIASVRVRVMGERDICGVTAAGQGGAREKRVVRGEVVSGVQEHPWQVRHRFEEHYCYTSTHPHACTRTHTHPHTPPGFDRVLRDSRYGAAVWWSPGQTRLGRHGCTLPVQLSQVEDAGRAETESGCIQSLLDGRFTAGTTGRVPLQCIAQTIVQGALLASAATPHLCLHEFSAEQLPV